MMETLKDRFLRYVAVETTSDEHSDTQPSTACQLDLLRMLRDELLDMGIDATMDEYGYVMASIPSNVEHEVDPIGFIAHVDTSPDASGKDIKPLVFEHYGGYDLGLNREKGIVMHVWDFPELRQYLGQTLITTDGTTLLGADDKAGVAEIMHVAQYITTHPDYKHGEVKIAFTPDEEIGRGVAKFDVKKFGAKYAYTIDGGGIGELEYENFNAAAATVHIQGRNIHPGYAKGKMLNAITLAMKFDAMMPVVERPELTEGYEGFYHLTELNGTVEEATMHYIIRDHNRDRFEAKKSMMSFTLFVFNEEYGKVATLEIKDQYRNMREQVEPHFFIVERAMKAMEMANVKPKVQPIRGGTDGANLSFMGLPCPNLFTGGHNFHGKFEYIPLESMMKATEVILNIITLFQSEG